MSRQHLFHRVTRHPLAWALIPLAALTACGGSGDDPATDDPGTPPPTPSTLTLRGTVATGQAQAAKTVEARCATGSGSAVSATDGRYEITLQNAALPCSLRATLDADHALSSLAVGNGSTVVANLTPISNMVVARLAYAMGKTNADFHTGFTAASVSADALAQAKEAVHTSLKESAGVDFAALGDPMQVELAASFGSTPGNAYDKALDTLNDKVTAAGTTMSDLLRAVAYSRGDLPNTIYSSTPTLPVALQFAPAAAGCKAARSGTWRYLVLNSGLAADSGTAEFDAASATLTFEGRRPVVLSSPEPCRFNADGIDLFVSPAGVATMRVLTEDGWRLAVAFPKQSHTLSALAGTWNTMGMDTSDARTLRHMRATTVTLDNQGGVTAVTACDVVPGPCTDLPSNVVASVRVQSREDGGFDMGAIDGSWRNTYYGYRAGGGALMLVSVSEEGTLVFMTPKVKLGMPTVDSVSNAWSLVASRTTLLPGAIDASRNTIKTVDAANGQYTREAVHDWNTGATRIETLVANDLRDGYTHRPGQTVAVSSGGTANVSEWYSLGMRGMGMSVLALPASEALLISTSKPAD